MYVSRTVFRYSLTPNISETVSEIFGVK